MADISTDQIPRKNTFRIRPTGLNVFLPGNNFTVWFKRWWSDLFLLSSNNVRSIGFYNSSHAQRIERFRQYRKYPSRIHPMSKFISFWNCVIVFAVIVNKMLFRFTSSILFDNIPLGLFYFAACLEGIIITDIFVNMMTGYIDQDVKKVILETKKCVIHYCSKKLFLHLMSATPMHWLMFLKYGNKVNCGLCKCNRFISVLKILSVFGLYRVFESTAFWTLSRSPNRSHLYSFLRIATVGFVTMLQFYDVTDVIWLLIVLQEEKLDSSSFITMLVTVRYGMVPDMPIYMVLCYDISRVFKSLFMFSFVLSPNSEFILDKVSSLIACIIAHGFYFWTLIECYSMISRDVYPKQTVMNAKVCITWLLATRQLSDELKLKVDEYFSFSSSTFNIFERQNALYKSLPKGLKNEIKSSCYPRHIRRVHSLLSDWPIEVMESLSKLLKQEIYLPNDIVAEAGTAGQGLIIVDVGVLAEYTADHVETGHLIDGDYYGEIALVTDMEVKMSYVVAVTPCRILMLEKMVFRRFMQSYPDLFYKLKAKLDEKVLKATAENKFR